MKKSNLIKVLSVLFLVTGLSTAVSAETLGKMSVFKSPYCGCCTAWMQAMEKAGFSIDVENIEDMDPVKKQAGIPEDMQACHTAAVDGYVIEGHVPLEAVHKLLEERPDIRGIAVPGMPMGSLGMGDDENARYTVYALPRDPSKDPEPFFEAGE
ncbi:DUF411 domain-containing protein [Coralliovum pocilloporae]|uniref:DUF411 domain-containing protein n=1 Tax=Coralliovum pocilloporae TaxID=3066369 RepID=UPI00330701D8